MNGACRRKASRLVGPPCRPFSPEESKIGTSRQSSSTKREVNRFGSPSGPKIALAVIAATPEAEVRTPVGSALPKQPVRNRQCAAAEMQGTGTPTKEPVMKEDRWTTWNSVEGRRPGAAVVDEQGVQVHPTALSPPLRCRHLERCGR